MPSIEMLRLVNSGTEATMSALRLARAATGRNKIVKFDGGYHGHVDSLLVKAGTGGATFNVPDSAGVPTEVTKLTISVAYNNLDAVRAVMDERSRRDHRRAGGRQHGLRSAGGRISERAARDLRRSTARC